MRIWCVCLGIVGCLVARPAYADCAVIPDGGLMDDFDGDGLADSAECGSGACPDRDMDGMSDRRDPDDDNDGILTCEERVGDEDTDTDGDGNPDYLEKDDDGDGLSTESERPDGKDRDTDGDDKSDHLDADDDGDGVGTRDEGAPGQDTDGDKTPDYLDTDDDGDGKDTADEGDATKDTDGDGTPDYLDTVDDPRPADGGADMVDGGDSGGSGNGATGGANTGGNTPAPGSGIGGGGLCGVGLTGSASSLGMLLLCLGLLLLRRRSLLGLALLCLCATQSAEAQAPVETYRASAFARDGLLVPRPEVPGHLRWSLSVAADYATQQIVYRTKLSDKNSDVGAVVGTGVYGHAAFALGLGERAALHVGLPVSLVMSGDKSVQTLAPEADGAGLMDAVLGGRVLLMGDAASKLALAGELVLRLPTAELADDAQVYRGEAYGSAEPALFLDARLGRVSLGARAGARFRKPTDVAQLRTDQEMLLSAALRVRLIESLEAQLELGGATPFTEVLDRDRSPFEALLGVRAYAGAMHLAAAAGPGISRGYGTPQLRAVLLVGYAPKAKAKSVSEDMVSSKPIVRGPRADPDHDGLFDGDDACPQEPEDRDGHDDIDGCPDLDNDEDGVPDQADKCQGELEDTDDFQDGDGCPEADNDADGLNDEVDSCPDQAEDKDGLADTDGCPEDDADGDSVADKDDACPGEAGEPDALGCPLVMQ